jgi:phosphatidylethanolamine-binding protein (PEBP) family uncharacterized protein
MRELEAYFGNHKIHNGEYIDLNDVQKRPVVKFSIPSNKFYTLLMVDPDVPAPNKSILHWMVVNNTDTVMDFKPSKPPGPDEHRYYLYLLEQPDKINVPTYGRTHFSTNSFINNNRLKPIASVMYKTSNK